MSPKNKSKNKRSKPDQSSPQTSPTQTKPAKIQAKSRSLSQDSMDEIRSMLDKIAKQQNELKQQQITTTESLKKEINEQNTLMKSEITAIINSMKNEFKAEIATINDKLEASTVSNSKKVDEISDKVDTLNNRINHVEKDFERLSHMNELKLVGIPFSESENLANIFINIANLISYDTSNAINIPSLSRLIIKNKLTNDLQPSATIIMKFAAVYMKETFYNLYLRLLPRKKITSKDLGFSSDTRIIVSENLTQQNHDIFIAASNLKREKKLAQVFTVNGIVNVKIQKGGKTHEIRHKHVLDIIFGESSTIATNDNTTAPTKNTNNVNCSMDTA